MLPEAIGGSIISEEAGHGSGGLRGQQLGDIGGDGPGPLRRRSQSGTKFLLQIEDIEKAFFWEIMDETLIL